MKINPTARRILSITALAWAIPLAQAGDAVDPASRTETRRERMSAAPNALAKAIGTRDDGAKLTSPVRKIRPR